MNTIHSPTEIEHTFAPSVSLILWPLARILTADHVFSDHGWCWCQPRVEYIPPEDEITIHRHFWDRPEYD